MASTTPRPSARTRRTNAVALGALQKAIDVLDQATQIAEKLFPMDGAQRREELQKIKATDQTLYAAVKHKLDEKSSGAKKDGLASAKQQGQQPGAQ